MAPQLCADRGAADPGGASFRIFQVSVFRRIQDSLPHSLSVCAFPDYAFLRFLYRW
jgi:hypothetical protein